MKNGNNKPKKETGNLFTVEPKEGRTQKQNQEYTAGACAVIILFVFIICTASTWVLFTALDKIYGG